MVAWARFYLAKAGLIDAAKRGLRTLTSEGTNTSLTHAEAREISREVQTRFKASGDEDEPAPEVVTGHELFDDPERSFWFVGAAWGSDDQTPRLWQSAFGRTAIMTNSVMKSGG